MGTRWRQSATRRAKTNGGKGEDGEMMERVLMYYFTSSVLCLKQSTRHPAAKGRIGIA